MGKLETFFYLFKVYPYTQLTMFSLHSYKLKVCKSVDDTMLNIKTVKKKKNESFSIQIVSKKCNEKVPVK